jgi:hypothetical protein
MRPVVTNNFHNRKVQGDSMYFYLAPCAYLKYLLPRNFAHPIYSHRTEYTRSIMLDRELSIPYPAPI